MLRKAFSRRVLGKFLELLFFYLLEVPSSATLPLALQPDPRPQKKAHLDDLVESHERYQEQLYWFELVGYIPH